VKQLVLLSGKGGTGKTSISAAFAHLSSKKGFVFVDADVDAANLSLVMAPEQVNSHEFWGGSLAEVQPEGCTECGACVPVCRYAAIFPDPSGKPAYWVDPMACDGCAACVYACQQGVIRMVQQQEGHWYQSGTSYGMLFHAELFPGRENSGKLVTLVKQNARLWAEDHHLPLVIVDGPPGIGCPVISACAGADLGLIVTEPSLAGIHDMKRVLGTLRHFRVPAVVCINKADIYPQGTAQIYQFAAEQGIEVIGEIPYDESVHLAMLEGIPVTAFLPEAPAAVSIREIYSETLKRLGI